MSRASSLERDDSADHRAKEHGSESEHERLGDIEGGCGIGSRRGGGGGCNGIVGAKLGCHNSGTGRSKSDGIAAYAGDDRNCFTADSCSRIRLSEAY